MATTKTASTKTAAEKPARAPKVEKPKSIPQVDPRNPLQKRHEMVGIVVSDKMQKTIVVKVDRRVRHSLYGKFIVKSRRFKAHDEKNDAKIGDRVTLIESRPLSREKRWALQSIIRRAGQTHDVNV